MRRNSSDRWDRQSDCGGASVITTLSLPEALIVLSCSWPREVVLSCPPPRRAVSTAVLMELELRGRIRSSVPEEKWWRGVKELGRSLFGSIRVDVEIIDRLPTGDAVLDRSLAAVVAHANGATVSEGRIHLDDGIGQAFVNRVVEQGWFAEARRKGLVRRRPKYRVANSEGVRAMKQTVIATLFSEDELERRDKALIALLAARETEKVPLFERFIYETELEGDMRDRAHKEVIRRARDLIYEFPFARSLRLALPYGKVGGDGWFGGDGNV
jgi:Golgi phosphoprotein 3 (GPP34)